MTRAAILLFALAAAVFAAQGPAVLLAEEAPVAAVKKLTKAPPKRPATAQELEKWAKDLDSDEFHAREEATLNLATAGAPAIKYMKAVLTGPSLEATTRALHVLREIGLSSDLDTQDAARETLDELSKQESPVAKRASQAIAWLNEQRSSQTIRDLEKLGATIQRTEYGDELHEMV